MTSVNPIPLHPTPWYLRLLGFKKWRWLYSGTFWIYVSSIDDLVNIMKEMDNA